MLQRLQSIFISLAISFVGYFICHPIFIVSPLESGDDLVLYAYKLVVKNGESYFFPYCLPGFFAIFVVFLSVTALVRHGSLKKQRQIIQIAQFLSFALIFAFCYSTQSLLQLTQLSFAELTCKANAFMPIVASCSVFFAKRLIEKDYLLVNQDTLR